MTFVQGAEWASGPTWENTEDLAPTGVQFLDRPTRTKSLHRLH